MSSLKSLSHDQLLTRLRDLIQRDHSLEAELIAHLGEVDVRRLYLGQACPSMFHYCVHVLHFAEGVAYKRIAVARAALSNIHLRCRAHNQHAAELDFGSQQMAAFRKRGAALPGAEADPEARAKLDCSWI